MIQLLKCSLVITVLGALLSSLMLSGCMRTARVYGDTNSLSGLQQIHVTQGREPTGKINEIRYTALKTTALTLGAQSGLAYRAAQIQQILEKDDAKLNQIFNFRRMILAHNVVPPVLVEARRTLNLASEDAIRLSHQTYRIVSQAHFTSGSLTWRDYLTMNYKSPDRPDTSLLPINKYERKVWNKYVGEGWKAGIVQANEIYRANLSRLKRDYTGMALYKKLLAQGMVSKPFVAKAELGVTGNADQLRIGDEILRITALPKLQTNSKRWKPAVTHEQ